MSTRLRRGRKLASQIFVAQLVILAVTMAVGFVMLARAESGYLDASYQSRAAAIAETVAGVPAIRRCMADEAPGCAATIQDFATTTQHQTGASYVVVIDMNRVRHSHPIQSLIGQQVAEPIVAADGKVHLGIDNGSLGRSANARVPLYGPDGTLVGEISVGIKEDSVLSALRQHLFSFAAWFAIALAVGALASWALARHLKRRTFGLELDDIARLLQEREATLHGIREGVIAVDRKGVVTLVNDEASALLGLTTAGYGHALADLLPPGRLNDVLTGREPGPDQVVVTEQHCLVINRMPVKIADRDLGAVITLSDRSELEGLVREPGSVRGLTAALRAQQHEFDNRVHALAGLVELGRYDEALQYAGELSGRQAGLAERLQERIDSPQLVGLLVAKAVIAAERGVTLTISDDSALAAGDADPRALLTVVGNLVDNAIDAAGGSGTAGQDPAVAVTIRTEADRRVTVSVRDTGPGIAPEDRQRVFVDGYTTKRASGPGRRGLGLALVRRTVVGAGGSITVTGLAASDGRTSPAGPVGDATGEPAVGTVFTVVLPPARSTADLLA